MTNQDDPLVIVDYNDLLLNPKDAFQKLSPLLSHAMDGPTSLGIIAIRNIPSFVDMKESFLPLAYQLVHLPKDYLENELSDPKSLYNSGYSHGKEMLKHGKPDLAKASFYFNPITDVPGTASDREKFPVSYPINKWPSPDMLPNLEDEGKKLGSLMKDVVAILAKHIDLYIQSKCPTYKPIMGEEMKKTEKVKARMLYYFPLDDDKSDKVEEEKNQKDDNEDSWIGWHNDSGFLTALAGDIYVDHNTGKTIPKDRIDPNAGLYIMDRNGSITQIKIPEDCMAVQIGECLQIISGGHVVATPHCVRGADPKRCIIQKEEKGNDNYTSSIPPRVARISFPCFVDTIPAFPLNVPESSCRESVLNSSVTGCARVPPLGERWTKNGMEFGAFLQDTFSKYYEWLNEK